MKKIFLLLGLTLGLMACDNELDLIEDWKDIPIVYGVVDPSDSAHYIRVEKAFVDANISALEIAQVADSLYYEDVEVYLSKGGQSYKMQKVDGNLEGYPRDEGVFASLPNYLYKLKAEELALTGDEEIFFSLLRPNEEEVNASIQTVGEYRFTRPNPNDPEKLNLNYINHFTIRWKESENAVDYSVYVIIHYDEKLTSEPNDAYVSKQVRWKAASGVEENSVVIESRDFFSFLGSSIEEDLEKVRAFGDVEFRILAVGKDLSDYIEVGGANLGITASQEIPKFTNLSEGYGIFSSKWEISLKNLRVTQETRDSILDGIYTRHLNFVE